MTRTIRLRRRMLPCRCVRRGGGYRGRRRCARRTPTKPRRPAPSSFSCAPPFSARLAGRERRGACSPRRQRRGAQPCVGLKPRAGCRRLLPARGPRRLGAQCDLQTASSEPTSSSSVARAVKDPGPRGHSQLSSSPPRGCHGQNARAAHRRERVRVGQPRRNRAGRSCADGLCDSQPHGRHLAPLALSVQTARGLPGGHRASLRSRFGQRQHLSPNARPAPPCARQARSLRRRPLVGASIRGHSRVRLCRWLKRTAQKRVCKPRQRKRAQKSAWPAPCVSLGLARLRIGGRWKSLRRPQRPLLDYRAVQRKVTPLTRRALQEAIQRQLSFC